MPAAPLGALVRAFSALRVDAVDDEAADDDDAALMHALLNLLSPRPGDSHEAGVMAAPRWATHSMPNPDSTRDIAPPGPTSSPDLGPVADSLPAPVQQAQTWVGLKSSLVKTSERADLANLEGRAATTAPSSGAGAEPASAVIPAASLFAAGRVRAILRDMVSTERPDGEVDLGAAVAMIARAEPIRALSRRLQTSLGHTIQLLFDVGPTLLPFARDRQQLADDALRLLGRDRVRIADFIGGPGRAVREFAQVRWAPLRWPSRGSTLLVVSDLGIGAPIGLQLDTLSDWVDTLDQTRRRGVHSVALIPYSRDRWPAIASAFDVALLWDRGSGVQTVRRSARARQ